MVHHPVGHQQGNTKRRHLKKLRNAHEQYQLLVGEIGVNRREYLYDMMFWEILLTIRGYFRRSHAGWEQARLIAYNAHYCMGSKNTPPTVDQWLPFPWESYSAPITDNEVEEIQDEIKAYNDLI